MSWIAVSLAMLLVSAGANAQESQRWTSVPPADLSRLRPADFDGDELDLPYHLAHFHRVANSVVEDGPQRGFIALEVWRGGKDYKPYNARVMENILSLVWFYTADRPWNPYRQSEPLRQRLEAAMDFWCGMQNDDGRFSEYGPQKWNLPATAFATKFMGQALILLAENPDCPIDADLHQRVTGANRRAILAVLTRDELYRSGTGYSNQYTNVWAGAAAHLHLHPGDDEVRRRLLDRMAQSLNDFQSPAGYHYEAHGPDFGYGLSTHTSNQQMAWALFKGTPAAEHVVESERRWIEWLSYNFVPEPDGSGFAVNSAIETRQNRPFVAHHENPMFEDERLALGRAWMRSDAQLAGERRRQRAELERDWPEVPKLVVGSFSPYTPYTFLHRTHRGFAPTAEQKQAAIAMLPPIAQQRFVHQRADRRREQVFMFVRRPAYYATFNAGQPLREQQRLGLGLMWGPRIGAVMQSQSGSEVAAWGTRAGDATRVYEAAGLSAKITVDDAPVPAEPGARDLPTGEVAAGYALGESGHKSVRLSDDSIEVEVEHAGGFVEVLPLLVADADELRTSPGSIKLQRGDEMLVVRFEPAQPPNVVKTDHRTGPRKRVVAVHIPAEHRLRYTMQIMPTQNAAHDWFREAPVHAPRAIAKEG